MLQLVDLRGTDTVRGHLPRPAIAGDEPVDAVREVLAAVRERGDDAVREFTTRFDDVVDPRLEVPAEEVRAAVDLIDEQVREALEAARDAIRAFHETQIVPEHSHERNGVVVEGRRQPVDRAGLYVPGGRAAYPSTVLMTAVPARVAGVPEVVLCVPPGPDGAVPTVTLAAAALAGVDRVFAIGGAQAIAAMAYGTETVPVVDTIAGPGNVFVAVAKREVAGSVGIPSAFAGPSEVVVVADSTAPVDAAAIDIVVQAEHGPGGLAWLVTWDEDAARSISTRVGELTEVAPRRADIEATLGSGGYVALVDDPDQAAEVVNEIAPEHAEIMTADPDPIVAAIRHAGAVFVGPWAPASIGDYVAGPSHVLPTFGSARFGSALTVDDFQKTVHIVRVGRDGLETVGPWVETIAQAEGLDAHAASISIRQGLSDEGEA